MSFSQTPTRGKHFVENKRPIAIRPSGHRAVESPFLRFSRSILANCQLLFLAPSVVKDQTDAPIHSLAIYRILFAFVKGKIASIPVSKSGKPFRSGHFGGRTAIHGRGKEEIKDPFPHARGPRAAKRSAPKPPRRILVTKKMYGSEKDAASGWEFPTIEKIRSRLTEVSIAELSEGLANIGLQKDGQFSGWTERRLGLLEKFHITADVQRLVNLGINKETLGLSLFFINMAPGFDYFFKDMFGDKRTRLRTRDALRTPLRLWKA